MIVGNPNVTPLATKFTGVVGACHVLVHLQEHAEQHLGAGRDWEPEGQPTPRSLQKG